MALAVMSPLAGMDMDTKEMDIEAKDNHKKKEMQLLDLPEELVLGVLSWLPLSGLRSCTEVSWGMYRLAKDPSLWKGLFIERTVTESFPSARLWCSSVVLDGKMYLYGGHTTQGLSNLISNVKNDLCAYDFATKKWEQIEHQMSAKTEHKCVPYNGLLWIVGGYNGYDYTNDIYVYDPVNKTSTFIETTGTPFSRRSALTAVVWENKLIVFGGWNGFSKTWFNDLYEFNFDTKVWRQIDAKGKVPVQRTSHSAVVYKNKMYIFAGFSGEHYLNDIHELDLETETWTEITPLTSGDKPDPRSRFCAAVHGECMYVLGGWNKVGYFNDFYVFNLETKVWTKITSNFEIPSISQYALCRHEEFLYVFGGFCAKTKACINKLYVYHIQNPRQSP
jgi:N-acetylneuraminic acid mutarotase